MTDRHESGLSRGRIFLWFQALMLMGLAVSFIPGFESGVLGQVKKQISFNSEAFTLALLVSIELAAREKLGGIKWIGVWWSFLSVAYLATVSLDGLDANLVTLNESILGALLISVFLSIMDPSNERRWGWRWLFPLGAGMVALIGELIGNIWASGAAWIMRNAETLGFAILISVLFGYLAASPWARVRPSRILRVSWILLLISVPLVVAAVNPHGVDAVAATGVVESLMVWIQRITESFIAALLVTALCWLIAHAKPSKRQNSEISRRNLA